MQEHTDSGRCVLMVVVAAALIGCSAVANGPPADAGATNPATGGSTGLGGAPVDDAHGGNDGDGGGGNTPGATGSGAGGVQAPADGGTPGMGGNDGSGGRVAPGDIGGAGGGGGTPARPTGGQGGSTAVAGRGGVGGSGTTGGFAGASAGGAAGAAPYSPCPVASTPCKILPFGDSITFGVGSNGGASNGGYRVQLFHRALQDGKRLSFVGTAAANGPTLVDGVPFPRQNEGHSGATIDDEPATATLAARSGISSLVATVMPATKPDIVMLMIGTNDIQHDYDVANAPVRLAALIDSIAAADAHTLIVVAQITATADATVNAAVEAFNAAIPALVTARAVAGKHVMWADMYHAITGAAGWRTTGRTVPDPTVGPLFDWLHPNVAGYQRLGDAWYEAIKGVLR